MNRFTIIYEFDLPEDGDADAFETFLRERYLPAVHRGPTRVGVVTSLTLWRGVSPTHEFDRRFLLHMGFDGLATGTLRVDDAQVVGDFDAFGVQVSRLGAYARSAEWPVEAPAAA